ncbi:MAG: hypothetical protein K2O67_03690, partial [Clostridia bacterium]|nr:hypothetical protein [Clostridia bacterium]
AKLTISYAAGGLIVIMIMAAFYSLYSVLAPTRSFAISNMSVFFPVINFVGRIDLYIVYMFDLVVLFAIVLNVQMCVHCLCKTFNNDFKIIYSVCVNAALIGATFLFNYKYTILQQIAGNWLWIPTLIFAYLIPVLAWTLRRKTK